MKTGNRNIAVGILVGTMGEYILFIIARGLITQPEAFTGGMIVMVIIVIGIVEIIAYIVGVILAATMFYYGQSV